MVKRFLYFAALAAIATLAHAATMEEEVRAVFDKYVAIQNAHDLKAMRNLLADSPDFLWISRGKPIWGREAALKSLEERYKGTWHIDVDRKELRVISISRRVAQVYAPRDVPRRHKFRYDRIYVRRRSWWLDVRLILVSFWISVQGTWEARDRKF